MRTVTLASGQNRTEQELEEELQRDRHWGSLCYCGTQTGPVMRTE